MTFRLVALTALAASLLCLASASAQEESSGEVDSVPSGEPEIRYKQATEVDFGERGIEGRVRGPVGVYSGSLPGSSFQPLLRLKTDFDTEILASVQSVR